MTQLVQSLLERLSQLPESMQNHLAERFLKALAEAEDQTEKSSQKRWLGSAKGPWSSVMILMILCPIHVGLVKHEAAPRCPRSAVVAS